MPLTSVRPRAFSAVWISSLIEATTVAIRKNRKAIPMRTSSAGNPVRSGIRLRRYLTAARPWENFRSPPKRQRCTCCDSASRLSNGAPGGPPPRASYRGHGHQSDAVDLLARCAEEDSWEVSR